VKRQDLPGKRIAGRLRLYCPTDSYRRQQRRFDPENSIDPLTLKAATGLLG